MIDYYMHHYGQPDDAEEWGIFDDDDDDDGDEEEVVDEPEPEPVDEYAHLKEAEIADPNWCEHEFIDNGFKKSYCIRCHCVGEFQEDTCTFRRVRD